MRSGTALVGTEPVGLAQPPSGLGFEWCAGDHVHFTMHGRRGSRAEPGLLIAYGESWAFLSAEDYDFWLEDDERTLALQRKTDVAIFRYDLTQLAAVRFVRD